MKRYGIRKNNRGDSLILVIGCIALISIVGVVLLAKSIDNRNMKVAEEQGQASFVGAESGSAEMVTVLETVALDVVGDAFEDMMLEYSLMANNDARNNRYNEYFRTKVDSLLSATTLQTQLETALGSAVTDLSVVRGDVEVVDLGETDYSHTVRVKDVVFNYAVGGSKTKITTDICVKAKLPNVSAGFDSGISCDFLDFALISDGSVSTINKTEDMIVNGNMYVGDDLVTDNADTKIYRANKLLVKNEIKLDDNAGLWVKADGVTINKGEGIWAGGISVNGSTLDTEDVNLYVKDDLAVESALLPTKVELKGASAEYVGYSGNSAATVNHERSSAININECSSLVLNLSTLGELYIDGNSYICENNNNWGDGFESDGVTMKAADGILQGESIAYKDMQALYLFPGACLPNHKHNPIIGDLGDDAEAAIGTVNLNYGFKQADDDEYQYLYLSNYVDNDNPYVIRTAVLDGGATVATYVYLNFKDAASAAQYVSDYMNTFLGDGIREQIKNLGSTSSISLPTDTYTLSNAISYDGTNLTLLPAADAVKKNKLDIASLLAERQAKCLFSSLRLTGSTPIAADYRMVRDGILSTNAFNSLAAGEEKEITVGAYKCYVYNGNLNINTANKSKYDGMQGILLVNGDLTVSATPLNINGLVLVTGSVTQGAGATLTADKTVVETLLANDEVAKYFRVYGADSSNGYLSTDAVKISFENWHKN